MGKSSRKQLNVKIKHENVLNDVGVISMRRSRSSQSVCFSPDFDNSTTVLENEDDFFPSHRYNFDGLRLGRKRANCITDDTKNEEIYFENDEAEEESFGLVQSLRLEKQNSENFQSASLVGRRRRMREPLIDAYITKTCNPDSTHPWLYQSEYTNPTQSSRHRNYLQQTNENSSNFGAIFLFFITVASILLFAFCLLHHSEMNVDRQIEEEEKTTEKEPSLLLEAQNEVIDDFKEGNSELIFQEFEGGDGSHVIFVPQLTDLDFWKYDLEDYTYYDDEVSRWEDFYSFEFSMNRPHLEIGSTHETDFLHGGGNSGDEQVKRSEKNRRYNFENFFFHSQISDLNTNRQNHRVLDKLKNCGVEAVKIVRVADKRLQNLFSFKDNELRVEKLRGMYEHAISLCPHHPLVLFYFAKFLTQKASTTSNHSTGQLKIDDVDGESMKNLRDAFTLSVKALHQISLLQYTVQFSTPQNQRKIGQEISQIFDSLNVDLEDLKYEIVEHERSTSLGVIVKENDFNNFHQIHSEMFQFQSYISSHFVDNELAHDHQLSWQLEELKRVRIQAYYSLIHHSAAIEGNTLTFAETEHILKTRNIVLSKGKSSFSDQSPLHLQKSITEHNEILGLDLALRFINRTLLFNNKENVIDLSIRDILHIHRRVIGHVDPVSAGIIRRNKVYVGDFKPPDPSHIAYLLNLFLEWLKESSKNLYFKIDQDYEGEWKGWERRRSENRDRVEENELNEIEVSHPIELAALAHYKLVFIHPFSDGNGRTSRLVMNLVLMHYGYPPVIIANEDRLKYYETLVEANSGDLRPFVRFIAECTNRTLALYSSLINMNTETVKKEETEICDAPIPSSLLMEPKASVFDQCFHAI